MNELVRVAQTPRDAVRFLQMIQPGGPWLVTVISQDRKRVITKRFAPGQESLLTRFVVDCNSAENMCNVYWHPATPMDDVTGRPKKEQIKSSRLVWVDADPRVGEDLEGEQARLRALFTTNLPKEVPQPKAVVFSGGGVQGFWDIGEDCYDLNKIERINKHLSYVFGGDSCHSCEHLLRLPFSMNWPDERKRKKGRKPALATVVAWDDVTHPIDSFTMAPEEATPLLSSPAKITLGKIERLNNLDELNQWDVPDDIKIICAQGHHPDKPKREGKDSSGSGWVWHATCGLVRCDVPTDVIASILTDPGWPISEHVLRQKNPVKYAIRQIERAMVATRDFVRHPKTHMILASLPENSRIALERLGIGVTFDLFQDRPLIAGLEGEGPIMDDTRCVGCAC
jgi:hypothetical protein